MTLHSDLLDMLSQYFVTYVGPTIDQYYLILRNQGIELVIQLYFLYFIIDILQNTGTLSITSMNALLSAVG